MQTTDQLSMIESGAETDVSDDVVNSTREMGTTDHMVNIIRDRGHAMHSREITSQLIREGRYAGKDFDTARGSVDALLSQAIRKEPPVLQRVKRGIYDLPQSDTAEQRPSLPAPRRPKSLRPALYELLSEVGEPMHYNDMADRLVELEIYGNGKRPADSSIRSELSKDVGDPRFPEDPIVRLRPGVYALQSTAGDRAGSPKVSDSSTAASTTGNDRLDMVELALDELGEKTHYRIVTRTVVELGLDTNEDGGLKNRLYQSVYYDIQRRKDAGEDPRIIAHDGGFWSLAKWMGTGVARDIRLNNQRQRALLLNLLTRMDPIVFEEVIGDLLRAMGFVDVEITKPTRDGGVDGRGTHEAPGNLMRNTVTVQVKRIRRNVTAQEVRDLRGAITGLEKGLLITTSDFTADARKQALADETRPIQLINGEKLAKLCEEFGILMKPVPVEAVTVDMNDSRLKHVLEAGD